MGREIFSGRIVSDFEGFDENAIFKLSNGTFWVQARYEYWYHYAYMPEAKIIEENGRTFLSVAGRSVPVNRVYDVIGIQFRQDIFLDQHRTIPQYVFLHLVAILHHCK